MIELAVFAAVSCAVGALAVAIYERRQDVLHGPYIERHPGRRSANKARRWMRIIRHFVAPST
ncbi:exported hypothetical protein [Bradyrhizobium sp. STM 3843]|nr:exported hypothetical protein [Bradyrhizobium sp. STM 3843]